MKMITPKPTEMKKNQSDLDDTCIKILIVDDDPIASAIIQKQLELRLSNCTIDVIHEPIVPPKYDIYFVDNDFGGNYLAKYLVQEIRTVAPQALIVALSTTLDLATMENMVNNGCNAVFDKRNPDRSWNAMQVIVNYIEVVRDRKIREQKNGFVSIMVSLKRLLSEWNQRIANAA